MIDMLPLHRELAAEAFEGVGFQCVAAKRFLDRGDDRAAFETYNRVVALFREFIVPEMKVIGATVDTLTRDAAIECRAESENARRRA